MNTLLKTLADSALPISIGAIIAIVVVVLVVILVLAIVAWWIKTGNMLKRQGIKCDEAASGIDVALTKRFDLLTKAVEVVRGVAKHEKETLIGVIEMRKPSADATMKEKSEFSSAVTKAFDSINIVAERYPELKANQNFTQLQNQVAEVEEQLQAARRLYNSNVSIFNQNIIVFPKSIVANHLHLTARDFFEAEEAKRKDVEIRF